jgi:outer membrane protein
LRLDDARRMALAAHPDLRASAFDEFAAREAVKIARAGYQPQAYGEAVQTLAPGGTRIAAYSALTDPTVIQRTAVGVGVSQYISDFGRTADLIRATQADLQAQAAAADTSRDTVLLNVTQAYFEVLRADALIRVANATVRERRTLLRQVRALARAGLRSTLDVSIAERDASTADQLALQSRDARVDAYASLAEALGGSDFRIYRLEDVGSLPAPPPQLSGMLATALRNNPQLAQAEAADAAAAARAAATARLASPTVTGYGFFGAAPFKESNVAIPSPYAAGGVALNVPIYNGGELAAERRQAEDLAAAQAERTREERDLLVRDVRTAFEDVQTAYGNIGVTDQLLRTAREVLLLTQTRYRIGLNSIADLSEAQLAEQQAAIAHADAIYDFIMQEASLEFAVGVIAGARG